MMKLSFPPARWFPSLRQAMVREECARHNLRRTAKSHLLAGFTLVEVTLAIGIISFAFVAMFGLLPVGLNVSREAIATTIETQIAQQMTTQALQTDFSQLPRLEQNTGTTPYYFDDQGKASTPDSALYKARFTVSSSTKLPSNVTTQKLATVTIYILNTRGNPAKAVPAHDPVNDPDSKKVTVLIPDNGL